MGRPRKSVVAKIAAGTFRPSRDGAALIAELGVTTLAEAYALVGHRKPGGQRKSDHDHRRDRTWREDRHGRQSKPKPQAAPAAPQVARIFAVGQE